jgi:hypothetical protein
MCRASQRKNQAAQYQLIEPFSLLNLGKSLFLQISKAFSKKIASCGFGIMPFVSG